MPWVQGGPAVRTDGLPKAENQARKSLLHPRGEKGRVSPALFGGGAAGKELPGRGCQWWNRRAPVKAMAMPYLSQHSITASSRTEPPGWAM